MSMKKPTTAPTTTAAHPSMRTVAPTSLRHHGMAQWYGAGPT